MCNNLLECFLEYIIHSNKEIKYLPYPMVCKNLDLFLSSIQEHFLNMLKSMHYPSISTTSLKMLLQSLLLSIRKIYASLIVPSVIVNIMLQHENQFCFLCKNSLIFVIEISRWLLSFCVGRRADWIVFFHFISYTIIHNT